ncbi:LytTR family transcriptional regulator DNA-binding domain-containing protein [Paenibacillus sp. 1P07SE]|uniref:LytTR family transcriptional regulator DNA-binding domain-containing protein n=1 Tax=Paenibacillus sp. 1P07SE TaxID=3132209 RepID=UPI0039A4DA75
MRFLLVGQDGLLKEVAISEVLLITLTTSGPLFHTASGVYRYARTMSQLLPSLQEHGFETLDRGNIVNLDRVGHYDPVSRVVYFEETDESDIRASVSAAGVRKLPDRLLESTALYMTVAAS